MTAALEFCPHHRGSPRLPIAHGLSAQQQGWHWALPRTETLQLPLEYRGKARCSWSFLQKSHNSQLVLSKSLLQVVSAGQGSHHHSPLLSESTACTCSQLSWCVLLKSRNFIFKAYAQWFIIYTFNITFIIFFHNLLKGSVTHFDQHSVLLGQEEFLISSSRTPHSYLPFHFTEQSCSKLRRSVSQKRAEHLKFAFFSKWPDEK